MHEKTRDGLTKRCTFNSAGGTRATSRLYAGASAPDCQPTCLDERLRCYVHRRITHVDHNMGPAPPVSGDGTCIRMRAVHTDGPCNSEPF